MPMVGMSSSRVTCAATSLGHDLEHDRERAGVLQRLGVLQQPVGRLVAAALHAVAAEDVDRLRGQADVGHHRDAGADQRLDLGGDPLAALELDRLGAAVLHEDRRPMSSACAGEAW